MAFIISFSYPYDLQIGAQGEVSTEGAGHKSGSIARPQRCRVQVAAVEVKDRIREQRWRQAWDLSESLLSDSRRRFYMVDVAHALLLQVRREFFFLQFSDFLKSSIYRRRLLMLSLVRFCWPRQSFRRRI